MDIMNFGKNKIDINAFHNILGKVRWLGEEPAWNRLDLIKNTTTLNMNEVASLRKELDR